MNTVAPLTVTYVDDMELCVAGLRTLIAEYVERIRLIDLRDALADPSQVDVVLHEPFGASSFSYSMLEDVRARCGGEVVAYSWATPEELPEAQGLPYLSKSLTAPQLVRALEDLVQGRALPAPPRRTLTSPRAAPADAVNGHDPFGGLASSTIPVCLTSRERQVLSGITRGLSNREIGDEMQVSINSVKTYIRTAYRKVGVSRRTQAVAWGLEHGIVDSVEDQAEVVAV